MDSLKEKMRVVMLPSEKASCLHLVPKGELDVDSYGIIFELEKPKILHTPLTEYGYPPQHLYIIGSVKKLEVGDYIPGYDEWSNKLSGVIRFDGKMGAPASPIKVFASSDKSLELPEPSKEFIKAYIDAYNKGEQITEILVDMESKGKECGGYLVFQTEDSKENSFYRCENCDNILINPKDTVCPIVFNTSLEIKVKPDNTISINRVKETWDNIINQLDKVCGQELSDQQVEWLKQHYEVPTKLKP